MTTRTFRCPVCDTHYNSELLSAPPRCDRCDLREQRDDARRECTEQREAKEAAYSRLIEITKQRDELASWHEDEKTWRIGAEQERDDAMQRVRALEDDCETAGAAMATVCLLATLRFGEKYAGPTDHAAVAAVVEILAQRDAVAIAAKEYLMRSVPLRTYADAEENLRNILADMGAQERDEQ